MKKVIFKQLKVTSFKNHEELTINFGEITNLTAANGKGKTGIGESITWLLYNVDMNNTKFDPTPIIKTEETPFPEVELFLNVDGKDLLLSKELQKTAKYFINEIPKKATEFDSLVADLFDKQLFMSMFNPTFFFTQHHTAQRDQLLRYVSEPLDKEVLEALTPLDRERLEGRLEKHTIKDLESKYQPQIKSKDTEYERAAERYLTLKQQLEKEQAELKEVDAEKITAEMEEIKETVLKARERNESIKKAKYDYDNAKRNLLNLQDDVKRVADIVNQLNVEELPSECKVCGQDLQGEALEKVKHAHENKIQQRKQEGKSAYTKFLELQANFDAMELPAGEEIDTNDLMEKYYQLQNDLTAAERIAKIAEDVKQAEENKDRVRQELGTARGVIESIKKFHTKQADLMVDKVNGLLDQLTVKLFEEKKNGSIVPTFEIKMDGKEYTKLSTAERIKAGLELAEVLIKQSGVSIPVFIDNAESILKYTAPSAQLITAKVKAGELKIETKGELQ